MVSFDCIRYTNSVQVLALSQLNSRQMPNCTPNYITFLGVRVVEGIMPKNVLQAWTDNDDMKNYSSLEKKRTKGELLSDRDRDNRKRGSQFRY